MALPAPPSSADVRRGPGERALGWLYMGPLGHLWSVLADITMAWLRWAVGRARASARARLGR